MKNVRLVTWYELWINKMAQEVADEIDREFLEKITKILNESESNSL